MSTQSNLFERLKARGEEVFTQVSNELMSNPRFMSAMQSAMRGKEKLDQAVGKALKNMNIPTRTEFKKALSRIESLEAEVAGLKAKAAPKTAGTATSRGRSAGRKRLVKSKSATKAPG